MAPSNLLAREATPDDGGGVPRGIYIAGFCVAGIVGLGLAIWVAIIVYKKRVKAKAEAASAARRATRISVADVHIDIEKASLSDDISKPKPGQFNRANLTASIILPAKTLTRDEVLAHHAAEGNLPRPFRPLAPAFGPFSSSSFPIGDSEPASSRPPSGSSFLSPIRNSFSFGGPGGNSKRSSYRSARSSIFSTISSISNGAGNAYKKRKVRQLFTPILPDELVLSLSETVSVAQTFDDGWCIVGRDSMFKTGEVELGAVPSWCFVKPTKGLKCERPIRSSSLGVTVQLDAEGPAFREDIISWSNF